MVKISPYHEILYNEWKLNSHRSDYNIVLDHNIYGAFDHIRLQQALQRFSQDYFLLQSHIAETVTGCYWIAQPGLTIDFDYIDEPQTQAELLLYVKTSFNIETGPLSRVRLIKVKENNFRLIIVMHHLIMDGAKGKFIFDAIQRYYNEPQYQFEISVAEQCKKLNGVSHRLNNQLIRNGAIHVEFWRTQLADLSGPDLRFLKSNVPAKYHCSENNVGEYLFNFDESILKQLRKAAKIYQITPYILSQIIFSTLLYRYTSQERFGICFPFAINEGGDFIYGTHVSHVAIPYQFDAVISLKTIINNVKNYLKSVKNGHHQYYPLQKLLINIVSKDILSVGFSQTNLKDQKFNFFGTTDEEVNTSLNIDLAGKILFSQEIKDQHVFFRVLYNKKEIDADLLWNFIQTYQRLLVKISEDLINGQDDLPVNEYSLLTEEQYHLLTVKWNQTSRPFPCEKTLHQLFEEQVLKTPDAIAVVYEDTCLSYAALNQQANQLAHYIKAKVDIQPDDLIALCVFPSHHMIVALWAVLKAGAAYVPIDPAYPKERISYLLKDQQTKLLLTDPNLVESLTPLCQSLSIDLINIGSKTTWENCCTTNPEHSTRSHHLAYVIYTSGTTGQPKGVLIEHHSVINYIDYLIQHNQFSPNSIGAKYTSFSFDASVIEIYPILLSGGKLCIINNADRLDCNSVNIFFEKHGITNAFLPTAFAELFLELKNNSLKNLMIGGERIKKIKCLQEYKIINVYGPTEATVQSTLFVVKDDSLSIPIGKPIQNGKCYVCDQYLNLLPIGAIGELLIGGEGLARGYLHNTKLSTEKFISNPFQTCEEKDQQRNHRLYKTGDLVRWLPDGNLEYVGRNDSQVKIRGYRIELGEIENQLMHYPGIQQVFVTVIDNTEQDISCKKLVAYYVAVTYLNDSEIRTYLLKYLPEYMIPSSYIFLPKLPTNNVGKLDRSLLPKPNYLPHNSYVPPTNLIEKIVCTIYATTLDIEENKIGIYDDFFQLGGNSITAIYLARKLSQYFTIIVTDIFKLKTPANIIREIPRSPNSLHQKIKQIELLYSNRANILVKDWEEKEQNSEAVLNHHRYLAQVRQLQIDVKHKKEIQNILLTGATGHLGFNLLDKILTETSYTIYLPVRANSNQEAFLRIEKKFQFYSGKTISEYLNRIHIFPAVLEESHLGLTTDKYQELVNKIDSIIHCAALVKYYGNDHDFYLSNVQPTANLLAFSRLTKLPDFHYISTVGVLQDGYIEDQDYYIFNEHDSLTQFVRGTHPYLCSKYAAEQLVIESRKEGILGTIYRVGNLTMHSESYRIQQDFENNFFFSHIKAMLQFGIVPNEIAQIEISPVDYTALAIVKLFDKSHLANQIYHVFNHQIFNLFELLKNNGKVNISPVSCTIFIEKVLQSIDSDKITDNSNYLLMLYQFWLQEVNSIHSTTIRISTEKTKSILEKLNFYWPTITKEMFVEFIEKSMTPSLS